MLKSCLPEPDLIIYLACLLDPLDKQVLGSPLLSGTGLVSMTDHPSLLSGLSGTEESTQPTGTGRVGDLFTGVTFPLFMINLCADLPCLAVSV